MKKILSVLLAIAMLVSVMSLAACNSGNGPQGNDPADDKPAGMASYDVPAVGYDGSAVTVVFYHSMGA